MAYITKQRLWAANGETVTPNIHYDTRRKALIFGGLTAPEEEARQTSQRHFSPNNHDHKPPSHNDLARHRPKLTRGNQLTPAPLSQAKLIDSEDVKPSAPISASLKMPLPVGQPCPISQRWSSLRRPQNAPPVLPHERGTGRCFEDMPSVPYLKQLDYFSHSLGYLEHDFDVSQPGHRHDKIKYLFPTEAISRDGQALTLNLLGSEDESKTPSLKESITHLLKQWQSFRIAEDEYRFDNRVQKKEENSLSSIFAPFSELWSSIPTSLSQLMQRHRILKTAGNFPFRLGVFMFGEPERNHSITREILVQRITQSECEMYDPQYSFSVGTRSSRQDIFDGNYKERFSRVKQDLEFYLGTSPWDKIPTHKQENIFSRLEFMYSKARTRAFSAASLNKALQAARHRENLVQETSDLLKALPQNVIASEALGVIGRLNRTLATENKQLTSFVVAIHQQRTIMAQTHAQRHNHREKIRAIESARAHESSGETTHSRYEALEIPNSVLPGQPWRVTTSSQLEEVLHFNSHYDHVLDKHAVILADAQAKLRVCEYEVSKIQKDLKASRPAPVL